MPHPLAVSQCAVRSAPNFLNTVSNINIVLTATLLLLLTTLQLLIMGQSFFLHFIHSANVVYLFDMRALWRPRVPKCQKNYTTSKWIKCEKKDRPIDEHFILQGKIAHLLGQVDIY